MTKDKTYKRTCPQCGEIIVYSLPSNFYRARTHNVRCKVCSNKKFPSEESKRKMSISKLGDRNPKYWEGKKRLPFSIESIAQMSMSHTKRYLNIDERKKTSKNTKIAMHRPDVRKKHIEALHKSKWLKVRTDQGQVELLEKWNKLGFHFQPNYQIHTDKDLFYVDGYDPVNQVVLEYDSKYHQKPYQKVKDEIRQQRILDILRPKKFWRYNAMAKTWRNIR